MSFEISLFKLIKSNNCSGSKKSKFTVPILIRFKININIINKILYDM